MRVNESLFAKERELLPAIQIARFLLAPADKRPTRETFAEMPSVRPSVRVTCRGFATRLLSPFSTGNVERSFDRTRKNHAPAFRAWRSFKRIDFSLAWQFCLREFLAVSRVYTRWIPEVVMVVLASAVVALARGIGRSRSVCVSGNLARFSGRNPRHARTRLLAFARPRRR